MDTRFQPHNLHREAEVSLFSSQDPHLRKLRQQPLIHYPELLSRLPACDPGIFIVGGSRQVGKTTLLKLWMEKLLKAGKDPASIFFFTGELIDDHHSLVRLIQEGVGDRKQRCYVILDEVTYIKDWDKGIKFLADSGMFENVVLVITGSDLAIMKEAASRFPGRRGKSHPTDFHLYPLSFREFVLLKNRGNQKPSGKDLFLFWDEYLVHGGFLTAINDMAQYGKILPATFATYADWIRGDVVKRGKQEHYLRDVLSAIVKRLGTQITWNALTKDLSIDHPKTTLDYLELLVSMDAIFIQPALVEHRLSAAPKKAKKVMFTDPFILHAVRSWLDPTADPFNDQVQKFISSPEACGRLVEATVVAHYRRYFPVFYIKNATEIDLAYVHQRRFWPIEIKWTEQVREKEVKGMSRYKNGRILGKVHESHPLSANLKVEPLSFALFELRG